MLNALRSRVIWILLLLNVLRSTVMWILLLLNVLHSAVVWILLVLNVWRSIHFSCRKRINYLTISGWCSRIENKGKFSTFHWHISILLTWGPQQPTTILDWQLQQGPEQKQDWGPFSWVLWERLLQTAFVITTHEEGDKQSARSMLDRVIKREKGQYSLPYNLFLSCAIQR